MTFIPGSDQGRERELRALTHRALALVPATGEVDAFVDEVARHRCRMIKTLASDLPVDAPTGLWVETADVDYVVYPAGAAAAYRQAVICHELAHMLLDHPAHEGQVDTTILAPSVDAEVALRFFTRHGYEAAIESEAEMLATDLSVELDRRRSVTRRARTQDTVSERLR